MRADPGANGADPELYKKLLDDLYRANSPITLSSEYAYFIKENQLRFLIRLARYKFVARLVKKKDRLLEVGCGSGLGSIFLSQHCTHVTGIDVKGTEIDEARSINRRANVDFVCEDFFKLRTDKKFDVIVSLDVIEHMPTEKGNELVGAMARHLKDDGMLVVGTPSAYSYPYQGELSKASHVKCYDQDELVALIENHFGRTLAFCMNDEVVHTGFSKLAWYYFVLGFLPRGCSV